ncbi:MAG: protein kinase [Polyangiaceae bacterium]|nr:protein kinase [Polyangiaceae bacterium]
MMAPAAIGGRYLLEKQIGYGGMGVVWAARDTVLQRRVALKLLKTAGGAGSHARTRFEQEARTIAKMNDPRVVQVYDYGLDGDSPFIVMELLEGEDLEERLTRVGKLPVFVLLPLISDLAKALEAAHAEDIVHRDLKPANLFLARSAGGPETLKVLDFGVAALGESDAQKGTRTRRTLVGTPELMSPEQARGALDVDKRTDLWSFAVIVYRALTGRLPFVGATRSEVLVSICIDTPPPPSTLAPNLPTALDSIFEKALAKKASDRYSSATELATAVTSALTSAARSIKILAVDDEPHVRELLSQHFARRARQVRNGQSPSDLTFECLWAESADQALTQLRDNPEIDVTLTDIRMPGMDGLTFVSEARGLRPDMPIIVVSAFGDMTNLRSAMNRGAFDFLVKPWSFADLDATIEKALQYAESAKKGSARDRQNALYKLFVTSAVSDRMSDPNALDTSHQLFPDATVVLFRACGIAEQVFECDPRRASRALSAIHEIMVLEICSRGGTVERLAGSTVTALFSQPHHAREAVSAAFAIRAQLAGWSDPAATAERDQSSIEYNMCAAVATGPVVRACVGSRSLGKLDMALFGKAISDAQNLLHSAASGEILFAGSPDEEVAALFEVLPFSSKRAPLTGPADPAPTFAPENSDLVITSREAETLPPGEGPHSESKTCPP